MANYPLQADPRSVATVGENFNDGSVLELVTPASSGSLFLLFRKAGKQRIARQVQHSRCIYQPPDLDESLRRAIRFPPSAQSYGSTGKLLGRVRQLFAGYAGLPRPESALITAWAASSWFADCFSSPPTLLISGPNMDHAIRLFRLLHCVCRRSVLLGDLSRSAFLTLAPLGATLLINQPDLSPRIRALFATSNYHGVHVFGNGKISSIASSKAIFLGMEHASEDEGLHLALPPAHCDLLPKERQLSEIAQELQAQLLLYRLRNLDKVRDFSPSKLDSTFISDVARNLAASVLGQVEIVESIGPLLRRLAEDKIAQRGCDIHVAIIEVTWGPSHEGQEIKISRLAELANALLRCRGETLEYSAAEIGWKLKNFGFRHHRNGSGMLLKFSRENRFLLHQLAARGGLNLPRASGCALCSPPQKVDAERLM